MNTTAIPIFMYHSIAHCDNAKFRPFTVSPADFAQQMEYLSQEHYTPITVTQLIQARTPSGAALPERPVVLTFDDGFADFYTTALPILAHYAFPATLYVTTAYVGETSRWLRHEGETMRPMASWTQLREISAQQIECGAHTHTHPQLDTRSYTSARKEIFLSKEILEEHLGHAVTSFAYPFGYYTAQTKELIQDAQFLAACAVRHAMSTTEDDPFALPRLMVDADCSLDEFAALLSDQQLSPLAAAQRAYARARTPVWQLLRRCSASLSASFYERWSA